MLKTPFNTNHTLYSLPFFLNVFDVHMYFYDRSRQPWLPLLSVWHRNELVDLKLVWNVWSITVTVKSAWLFLKLFVKFQERRYGTETSENQWLLGKRTTSKTQKHTVMLCKIFSCNIVYVIWSKSDKTCKATGMETLRPWNDVDILLTCLLAAWIMFTRKVVPSEWS